MKDKVVIALVGFFGGVGPSLAELVSLTKMGEIPGVPFFVGTLIMGLMGAGVVLIAKETVPWKAFTQGMGAPAIFSTATTAATSVATSVALMIPFVPIVYADSISDTVSKSVIVCDSVSVIVDGELYKRALPGSVITIKRDSFETTYTVPYRDSVSLESEIYDPFIRRGLIQGLLPMQRNLTKQFEPRLIIKESKGDKNAD